MDVQYFFLMSVWWQGESKASGDCYGGVSRMASYINGVSKLSFSPDSLIIWLPHQRVRWEIIWGQNWFFLSFEVREKDPEALLLNAGDYIWLCNLLYFILLYYLIHRI